MSIDTQLLKKGMNVSRTGLLDQAKVHIALEAKHRAKLAGRGWTPELTKLLMDGVAVVESERAANIEARSASKANLEREHAAAYRAKALKRGLARAADDLYADRRIAADVRRTLRGSGAGPVNKSTTRLMAYLVDAEPQVRALDDLLKPYFEGASMHEELLATKTELETAQQDQEVNYAQLPAETKKVYIAKGNVLSLIEKMNRLGKLAFEGTPIFAQFNKDLIERAKRKRTPAAEPEVEPAES